MKLSMLGNRARAMVDLRVLRKNFRLLTAKANSEMKNFQGAIPMIKGNAYGHGLIKTGKALEKEKHALALGVASCDEAFELRSAGIKKSILIFSGISGLQEEVLNFCETFTVTPVLYRMEDARKAFQFARTHPNFRFQVKFNTGMNRLGVPIEEAHAIARMLKAFDRKQKPLTGICTHLAQAQVHDSKLTQNQISRFQSVSEVFSSDASILIHMANSALILKKEMLKTAAFCQAIRPGISLYGYAGEEGEKLGLRPPLLLQARVIQSRNVEKNQSIGYDATFKARKLTTQCVLAIGYADGFSRQLSNKKILVSLASQASKLSLSTVLGRVSMDLTSIEFVANEGKWVNLLGVNLKQGEWMATQARTIPYELLTSLTTRVHRIYS